MRNIETGGHLHSDTSPLKLPKCRQLGIRNLFCYIWDIERDWYCLYALNTGKIYLVCE